MSLATLFRRNPHRDAAMMLYHGIVEQARRPDFFAAYGVPDTLDGRFELIALHEFLVLGRLKQEHARTAKLAQELFDTFFADMDRALRELGVGDLAVGKHVKRMATAFYGRIVSYERGLAGDDAVLGEALARNLFGTVSPRSGDLATLSAYVRQAAASLAAQPIHDLMAGAVRFPLLEASRAAGEAL
ncbi:MAG: ubiquinol-cytochrome C chaperone family protein [Alphaproteobacteria bacterium]|nr:ubiquinol-cytochrome C chaperone family protein [Alphaproteobacteria bacterium]